MKSNVKKKRNYCDPNTEIGMDTEDHVYVQLNESVEDFLLKTRRLLIVGVIDELTSAHICSHLQLLALDAQPVYIYIQSSGGCFASGYAIIDQMLACRCPIYTIVRGQGYSMGAVIAAFGTKGRRFATPNSSLMLHSTIIHNAPSSIEEQTEMTEHLRVDYRRKISNLARRLKLTTTQLLKLMNKTKWMSPKQAIAIGLIDGIWTKQMELSIDREYTK